MTAVLTIGRGRKTNIGARTGMSRIAVGQDTKTYSQRGMSMVGKGSFEHARHSIKLFLETARSEKITLRIESDRVFGGSRDVAAKIDDTLSGSHQTSEP